jgi:3-hydroxyisobutyrate dehydrogenase-like beta-hydroxyacid dehydrogenase
MPSIGGCRISHATGRRVVGVIIGLLHPGMMGAAVGAQLVAGGHQVSWSPPGRSERSAARAEQAGLHPAGSLADLLTGSDVVFSICPPAYASSVAEQVAAAGYAGLFVEANAINPARMASIAARLRAGGATVVDGSIIGPPPGAGRIARFYLSGPADAVHTVTGLLAGSDATPKPMDERIGSASALKMAYGSFQKTSQALAAVSHALADDFGVTPFLEAEAARWGGNALAGRADFADVATQAWRWAPEMDEVAETLRGAGLPNALATGAANVFRRWDADKDDDALDPDTALRHLRN